MTTPNNSSLLIVVPTFNSYLLLPKLLQSIKRQTLCSWRILFVDGPSSPTHRTWLNQTCSEDPRCTWIPQDDISSGIFGAMNQGFSHARASEWILFWGSDDWAASPNVFSHLIDLIHQTSTDNAPPDLLVGLGRYADLSSLLLGRTSSFLPSSNLSSSTYRRALFLGSTPPHQATVFGPGARGLLDSYDPDFRLAADLDFFLRLSQFSGLNIQTLNFEIVHMGIGGVSSKATFRRLREVKKAYVRAFGYLWVIPFLTRYFRRLFGNLSLVF